MWLEEEEHEPLKTVKQLNALVPELIRVSQAVYDSWAQDDDGMDVELGAGGICQDIASEICGVLSSNGFDCTTFSQPIGDQHVYTVVKLKDGVYEVDIPPGVYETGLFINLCDILIIGSPKGVHVRHRNQPAEIR